MNSYTRRGAATAIAFIFITGTALAQSDSTSDATSGSTAGTTSRTTQPGKSHKKRSKRRADSAKGAKPTDPASTEPATMDGNAAPSTTNSAPAGTGSGN